MLKSMSIATRLLLASCLSAVVMIIAIVSFIKFSLIPQMTDKALENQTLAMANLLKELHNTPDQWSDEALSRADILDFSKAGGKTVATLFVLKNGQYVRAVTTLTKEDGSRATGTILDPQSGAAKALAAGQTYTGPITLFNRPHMATYLPVSFANGPRGAVFVGIDYGSADPMLTLAHQLNYVVIGVGIVSVLLLGVGLVFSIRVEVAHRETEDIMRTTQEGLFLLDHDLRMGTQASGAVSRILGFEVRPGANFLELLKPLITPKTYDTAKEYTELLMRHDVKEKLVISLNPLECIEISGMRPNGTIDSRFLQIRFNRVIKGKTVTHLLVTANYITRQVRLERELKESERRVQDQMGMMVQILQADPQMLQDFLGNATTHLNQINDELRTANPTSGISTEQIDTILRSAHQLKGDSAAMLLETITQSLHALETTMQELRDRPQRRSEDLLPVAVRVKSLFAEVNSIQDVIARIGQVRGVVSVEPPRPPRDPAQVELQPMVRQWNAFAQQLAMRHEKKVQLSYLGLDLQTLPSTLRDSLNTIVNQFIRNTLVHGAETPAERRQRGKPESAHISVYVSDQCDGSVELSFRDDGRGINVEDIRNTIIRNKRLPEDKARSLDARQLTMMIFEPGFSTRETADEDAGRGIGLDAVKDHIAKQGGRIRIGSTRGEYCHFRVQLPLKAAQADTEAVSDGEPLREVA